MSYRCSNGNISEQDRREFVSTLTKLKQDGASLLVVGDIFEQASLDVCTQMLGDETLSTRRRLFITTDADLPAVLDRLPTLTTQPTAKAAKQIIWSETVRSTAAPVESRQLSIPAKQVTGERLANLGIAISEAIAKFNTIADGLAPAELRICFDSLESLLSAYDHDRVFRFLHILIGRIQSVNAMAHFHLPLPWQSKVVQTFAPLFDATVELRQTEDQFQQRWHLQHAGITTPWLSLTEQ